MKEIKEIILGSNFIEATLEIVFVFGFSVVIVSICGIGIWLFGLLKEIVEEKIRGGK